MDSVAFAVYRHSHQLIKNKQTNKPPKHTIWVFVGHVLIGPVVVYILDMHLSVNLKAVDILNESIYTTNFLSSFSFFICFLKRKNPTVFLP